ncbi:hypothetical protein IM774_03450 [Erysipelotrichaceae bacterium RD49]|nr:hypothetical protein [Erysipelotrichaceae bacterium RD49]
MSSTKPGSGKASCWSVQKGRIKKQSAFKEWMAYNNRGSMRLGKPAIESWF